MGASRDAFARLPKVDHVLDAEPLRALGWRREIVRKAVQEALAELRGRIGAGKDVEIPDATGLAHLVSQRLQQWAQRHPRRVINATGVILHTNLGRAPLCPDAVEAMAEAAGYCDLEVDLIDGKRGSRFVWLRPLLAAAMGAPDVHVVNNNAAALLLACTVLGEPGGVALSRGQMVEIGDGFRVATMAGAGGCRVVAVGSTNRTHLRDYEAALTGLGDGGGPPASALLWVHQSNFTQSGYVSEVSLRELASLAQTHGVPLIADLGSGSLGHGLPPGEPTIPAYLQQGVHLVLASGDKLLGGPQAGIMAGVPEIVQRCRRHPMARALRPDKTAIAALHATAVAHARDGAVELPLHTMVARTADALRARAESICTSLGWSTDRIVAMDATIGGGSLPGDTLPSVGLHVPVERVSRAAKQLRAGDPPVIGRIEDDRLLVDLRTVEPDDDEPLTRALAELS